MFRPVRKQAVPSIAAPTASHLKGILQEAFGGRSILKVRLRYAKNAVAKPKTAPAPKTIMASANLSVLSVEEVL
jgi:hypothetical protein